MLFVADEVATGFGRTARMFACEWCGIRPDIVCLGKGITGGYLPMSATVASRTGSSNRSSAPTRGPQPSSTVTPTAGTPSLRAVALEHLRLFEQVAGPRTGVCQCRAPRSADRRTTLRMHPAVSEIRRFGLMAGVELASPERRRGGGGAYVQKRRAVGC